MSDAAESSSSAKIPAQILERLRRRSGAFERYSEPSEIDRGGQGAILACGTKTCIATWR